METSRSHYWKNWTLHMTFCMDPLCGDNRGLIGDDMTIDVTSLKAK